MLFFLVFSQFILLALTLRCELGFLPTPQDYLLPAGFLLHITRYGGEDAELCDMDCIM